MCISRLSLMALLLVLTAPAKSVTVTLLATTDLHGNLLPYDFYTAKPAQRGLAKIATLIQEVRAATPNVVLIDCGDTIQGAPLESVYQHYVRYGRMPLGLALPAPMDGDPMMRAMSYLKYDAMVVGNHEYNFGLRNLSKARDEAAFPMLSANTHVAPGAGKPFDAFLLKTVGGVKVAIIGITTPAIPSWEQAANIQGYTFEPGKEAVAAVIAQVRRQYRPDIVVVAAHAGLGRDLKTGSVENDLPGENMMVDIAQHVPGIDAIVFGHTHSQLESAYIGNVLLMQPKNWGISLGRMDFTLDDSNGRWRVTGKNSRLLPVTAATAADPELVKLADPYFRAAEAYLSTPVATAPRPMTSEYARVRDTALIDAIQEVQLAYAKADVSFASAFNTHVRVPEGPVTVREIAALYLYDNALYTVEATGLTVRQALENAARYYQQCVADCSKENLINPKLAGFNYDMAQGVEYEIDVSQPAGGRIRNLRWKGKPLADDQPLRIAVNSYRAGGSGGYSMFRDAKVVWRSNDEIRDMMVEYYTAKKTLPAAPDDNWRVVPEAARVALEHEAAADRGNRMQ